MAEFMYVFQLSRMRVFFVSYRTLLGNSYPYFATHAATFNQPKTDYRECGQCQSRVLDGYARAFYKKWHHMHLKELTDEQLAEMEHDIARLKKAYNFLERRRDTFKGTDWDFRFSDIKKLSMKKPKGL